MQQIAFINGQDAEDDMLRAQIFGAIRQSFRFGIDCVDVDPGAENPDALTISLFGNGGGDVLVTFDLADRMGLTGMGPDNIPVVRAFKSVLVPGRWHKNQLLNNPRMGVDPESIVVVGAPRIDILRRAQAARPPREPGNSPRVLFAPLHGNWSDSHGVMSAQEAFAPFLPRLRKFCDLSLAVDPRNLWGKVPVTEELLDADIVVTDYTCLIYEAWALGKPVIFPRWLLGDRILRKSPDSAEAHIYRNGIGHHPASFDEMIGMIRQGAELGLGAGVQPFMAEFADNYASGDAGRRIAQALERLADPDSLLLERQIRADAMAALARKDFERAETLLSALVVHDDFEAELFDKLALSLQHQKKWDQEAQALDAALALAPRTAGLHLRRADVHYRMGQYADAVRAYEQAVLLRPKAPAPWFYRLGLAIEALDAPTADGAYTAENAYAKSGALQPKLNVARFGPGVLHATAGRWAQAVDAFEASVRKLPLDAELRYHYGMALDRCYRWADAEVQFRAAIALDGKMSKWHYRLGFVLERQGRFEEAGEAYLFAARMSKVHQPSWFYRAGYVLEAAGRFAEAIAAYVAVESRTATAVELPDAYKQGFHAVHQQLYEDALANDRGNASLWVKYSKLLEKHGKLEDATKAAANAIVYGQKLSSTLFQRHDALQIVDRERSMIEERLAHNCSIPEDWLLLYTACEKQGDLASAAEALRQAVARSQEHKPAWYILLGRTLAKLGQLEEACEAFRHSSLLQRPHGVFEDKFETDAELRRNASYREFFDVMPIMANTVMYESFGGEGVSDNPLGMFRQIDRDPRFTGWTHIWVVDSFTKIPAELAGRKDIFFVIKETTLYLRYLATAQYLINNGTFPSYFVRRDGQEYLATWHGTPLKTLGYDIAATPLQRANTARNLIQASLFIAPNKHTENVMLGRYGVKELFTGTSLISGYPRIDMMVNATDEDKQRIRETLNIDPTKPVVLFAPTYRGHWATPEIETRALIDTLERLRSSDYNLLFRGHYFAEETLLKLDLPVTVAPHAIDSCQLLSIVDVLISDYSSIFYDFLLTERPVIHYVYDWDYYVSTRGVYFGKEDLPGIVCEDEPSLLKAVADCVADPQGNISATYRHARDLYCQMEDGHAAERVVDALFFGKADCVSDFGPTQGAGRLLMHCGELEHNRTLLASQALLRGLRERDYVTTVMVDRRVVVHDEVRTRTAQSMLDYTDVLIRFGGASYSLEEAWINDRFTKLNAFASPMHEEIYTRAMKHEARRLLGGARFDAAIDLDGTRPFWAQLIAAVDADRHIAFLNNDMVADRTDKAPHLERQFQTFKLFDTLVSPNAAVDTANQNRLVENFGLDAERFAVCHPVVNAQDIADKAAVVPIDADFAAYQADARRKIVSIENFWPEKRHDQLIDALAVLVGQGEDVALYLVGAGPQKLALQQQVASLGLGDRVILLDGRDNPYPYLAHADCTAFAFDRLSTARVVLEAAVLHVPAVVMDRGGLDELVTATGCIVTQATAEALAHGVRDALSGRKAAKFDVSAHNERALDRFIALASPSSGETVASTIAVGAA